MPIVWTNKERLKLIKLYRQHKCLTNPFHCDFKNKLCRYQAYREIVHSMNIYGLTVCDCIQQITFLKTQYCYELSKISAAISCDKYYVPKTSWFNIVHELLFPIIQTHWQTNNSQKIYNEQEHGNPLGNIQYSNKNIVDSLIYQNLCNVKQEPRKNCTSHEYTKFNYSMNKPGYPKRSRQLYKSTPTNCYFSKNKNKIDTESNTTHKVISQNGTQTDISSFKNHNKTNTCKEHNTSINTTNELDQNHSKTHFILNTPMRSNEIKRKKQYDEFDIFGRSVAFQLRTLNFEAAIEVEQRIQDLITKERLKTIKSLCLPQSVDSNCSYTCNDCKIICEDMICNCGLPLIKIKTNKCCKIN